MTKIGVTEAGDGGLDFSWTNKLYDINIIITKHLTSKNEKLLNALLNNADKIILHCTCTGYGKTLIEPNVPTSNEVYNGVSKLIALGFPVSQIVLRTDPIIPTDKGIECVEKVWKQFSTLGIERCRLSIIDMYPHVRKRFQEVCGKVPFESFVAPQNMILQVNQAIQQNVSLYKHFESCAENIGERIGCISKRDFDVLGLPFDNETGGFQRKGCLCVAGKNELLNNKKRCPSGCIYCYWHDK